MYTNPASGSSRKSEVEPGSTFEFGTVMSTGRYAAGSQRASMFARRNVWVTIAVPGPPVGPGSVAAERWSELSPQPSFSNRSSAMTRQ